MPPSFMNAPAHYLDVTVGTWFTLHISVANLTIILLMILVFVLALVLPFPGGGEVQR